MDSFEKVCDFTLRAVTATKSQGSETWETGSENFIEGLYKEQESNTGRKTDCSKSNLLLFFQY